MTSNKDFGLLVGTSYLNYEMDGTTSRLNDDMVEKERVERAQLLKQFPFQNITINGKFIPLARQITKDNKIVWVNPKGKVVHVVKNLKQGFKRSLSRKRRSK